MIGAIGQNQATSFPIDLHNPVPVSTDGVLRCYTNDLPFTYGNNSGFLKLTVNRISWQGVAWPPQFSAISIILFAIRATSLFDEFVRTMAVTCRDGTRTMCVR